jgi:hypothetical protein
MDYTPEDYARLYKEAAALDSEPFSQKAIRWIAIIGIGILIGMQWGCDYQAAEATHESVMDAYEKKLALMGNPCVYVAQCTRIEMECDPRHRKCVKSADLTKRFP